MRRKLIAFTAPLAAIALATLSYLVAPASASLQVGLQPADNATQTLGSATLYGTSTPLSVTAAAASAAKTRALFKTFRAHDSRTRGILIRHASRPDRARMRRLGLRPPSGRRTPIAVTPGTATGFNGLSHLDQRNSGTGAYVNTNFSLEPPDQGLCVGNGFVLESVNAAFAVYDQSGNALTGVNALNQFYQRSPAINRVTGVGGDFLANPKCYFDPVGQRWIQTAREEDAPVHFGGGPPPFGRTHVLVAVSQTSDPTGTWNLYSIDTTDDGLNGTPTHTACPCPPDQPLLGANRDGVFIDTNEFQAPRPFFFNGGQIYALGRASLESGASSVRFVHIDVGTVPTGDPNLPFWGSIQPAESIHPHGVSEMFMTGGPEDVFQNNAPLDNRIAVWSLTGTQTLDSPSPSVELRHVVLTSQTYGLAVNTGATQKVGPTPLRNFLAANFGDTTEPFEMINANDSRMNQVIDVNGILYGAVNTAVTSASGPPRVGVAFFAVGAIGLPGFLFAHILSQGVVAADNENVLFPSITVNELGIGTMNFTLSGPDFFPSAAYVRFALGQPFGDIHVVGTGAGPEDGFTGYNFFGGNGVARWGDYSAAVFSDGSVWMANEFIPGTPRSLLANYGTFISHLQVGF